MASIHHPNPDVIAQLISEQIPFWESQLLKQAEIIEKAERERERLKEMIDASMKLAQLAGVKPEGAGRQLHPLTRTRIGEARGRREVTWMTEIMRVLSEEARGASYEDLRAGIELGPLSERLAQSDKGLYGGVAKLEAAGELSKYKGRLFTTGLFADFQQKVLAGEMEDISEVEKARPSPMGDAILYFINANPGAASRDVVEHLRAMQEFEAVVNKNKTSAYNVLTRLVERRQLLKQDGSYYIAKNDESSQAVVADGE